MVGLDDDVFEKATDHNPALVMASGNSAVAYPETCPPV